MSKVRQGHPFLVVRVFAILLVGVSVVALAAAGARAEVVHRPLFELGEIPSEGPHGERVALPGPLEQMEAMAVDSGHLWVAEGQFGRWSRVDEFDAATGEFLGQPGHLEKEPGSGYGEGSGIGIAVGHGTGEPSVYVAGKSGGVSTVSVFGETGALQALWKGQATPGKSFGFISGVAADNSSSSLDGDRGDVFVVAGDVVDVFHPEASGEERYIGQISGPSPSEPFQQPKAIAVDELNGDVYVFDSREYTDAVVDVFEPNGLGGYALVRRIEGPSGRQFHEPYTMAVDSGNGEVYVTEFAPTGYYLEDKQAFYNGGYMIDEFSAAGAYIGHVEHIPDAYGIAVDPEAHHLYAHQQAYGPDIVLPDVTSEPVSAQTTRSVTLNGTVDPDGAGEATCQFDWGPTSALGKAAPCSEPVPNGERPVEVHAVLSEFERDKTYYYRLQASNENGINVGVPAQNQQFATKGAVVVSVFASGVSADSATLGASIDPGSTPTSYYFQYGLSTAYEQQSPAAPGQSIGSGSEAVEVPSLHLNGLARGAVYHYRAVAVSEPQPGEVEQVYSPDHTFTTQAAAGSFSLLDGRQWELVSPANKHGALIEESANMVGAGALQAAANGDAIEYRTSEPTESEPAGYARRVTVLATRGPQGWSSLDISEPNLTAVYAREEAGQEFQIASEDLSRVAVQPLQSTFLALSPQASEQTSYLRDNFLNANAAEVCRSGCYQPLVTGKAGFTNVPSGTVFGEEPEGFCKLERCGPKFQGASRDLSHVVLSSSAQLTATPAPAGEEGLYEWSNGSLQLLDQLPEGEEGPAGLAGTLRANDTAVESEWGPMGVRNSVSDDGARVILEGGAKAYHKGTAGLYLREAPTAQDPAGRTIRLDVPEGGSGPSKDSRYMDANSEATRIFFLDNGRLTADSSPSGSDLYEYDLDAPAGKRLRDLSAPAVPGGAANVAMVTGAGDDGSYVYFTAAGAIAPGAVEGECPISLFRYEKAEEQRKQESREPSPGCNLYVSREGVTRLVAVLPGDDIYDWQDRLAPGEGELFGRVAPNGRWLAFVSDGELTGYDPHDAVSGEADVEVYVYDAVSGKLTCVSCDPSGARPVGSFRPGGHPLGSRWVAGGVPWQTAVAEGDGSLAVHQPRYLSDSGRVFFDSPDALVPQDVNGAEDVYEWEPLGVGGCSEAAVTFSSRSDGCVDLISSGTSPEPSEFIDASESGGDVFFRSLAQLAPQDRDNAFDVYDAHECTSAEPCPPVRPAPPACSTEASCKALPSPQPALYGPPASAMFSGVGNAPQVDASTVANKHKAKRTVKRKRKAKQRRGKGCSKKTAGRRCARTGRARRAGRVRATRVVRGGGR